jgi:hypothetical protein
MSLSSFSSFQPRPPQSASTTASGSEVGAPRDDVQPSSPSHTRTNSRGTNPNPYPLPVHDPARYNRALDSMGAGGPVHVTNSDPLGASSPVIAGNRTPSLRPQWRYPRGEEVDEELGTETDGGGTTDGGETTDDEPTIRPGHSSASSEADTWSCSTTESEDEGVEDGQDGEMDVEVGVDEIQAIRNGRALSHRFGGHHREDGDLTPEKFGRGRLNCGRP